MSTPNIILTADDFGRSPRVNTAIAEWAAAGALTQASLMVNEPFVDHALSLAAALPDLRIGLHLALCDGLGSDGQPMTGSPAWAGIKFAFWPGARTWLKNEIATQFARFAALGLPATYWDGHTHLHLHPIVMKIALPIAVQHGFTFTRLVREPGPPSLLAAIFQGLSRSAVPSLRVSGVRYTDRVFGLRATGRMTREHFRQAFAQAREGTTEIYFHPGAESLLPDPEWLAGELRKTVASARRP